MTAKHALWAAVLVLAGGMFFGSGAAALAAGPPETPSATRTNASPVGQAVNEPLQGSAAATAAGAESEDLTPTPESDASSEWTPSFGEDASPCEEPCEKPCEAPCAESDSPCAEACEACMVGPSGRYWFRADYLHWWTRGVRVVPLVTTSTDQDDNGIIGQPTTSVLFGGERLDSLSRSGVRLVGGMWFDCGRTTGLEFDLFSLGQGHTRYSYTSMDGSTLYARPYIDAQTGNNAAELVSKVEEIGGTTRGDINDYFHSAGVSARFNICCCEAYCPPEYCCEAYTRAGMYGQCARNLLRARLRPDRYRVDLIAGYRHYRLDDTLRINEDLVVIFDPEIPVGTTYDIEDLFRTRNEFHGGELGFLAHFDRGCWSLELLAKIAFGNNEQVARVSGSTVITRPDGDTASYAGGLLTQPTNIGYYSRDDFVVIPQIGAEIGYQLTCHLRAYAGYNFLYWANVARAAEQVDFTVNTSQMNGGTLVGDARPAFSFHDSDFWAQGLNFGLEYRF